MAGSKPANSDQLKLEIIRTDTVISRLPAHNLFGQGGVNIQINRKDAAGHTRLSWKVSFSEEGEAGPLAYRLETLIINRRIDEAGRPVPTMLRLGSLTDICLELGINPSGANTNNVKRALKQNAGTLISANLAYHATDGGRHKLEATFTKYSVAFRGDELPNGERSDGVMILLNEQYRRVLNRAGTRPLDFQYLKELTPSAQRFYEILSYQMYAALKHGYPEARLLYSDYCAYSGQPRQTSAVDMNKRMYKIHQPHLKAGYFTKVTYQPTRDLDGNPDWQMCYVPGPRARQEFERFNRRLYTQDHAQDLEWRLLVADEANTAAAREAGDAATALVQHFHQVARGVRAYQPRPNSAEVRLATEVLAQLGPDGAAFWVDYAVRAARQTNFKMATLGGAGQYLAEATAAWQTQRSAPTAAPELSADQLPMTTHEALEAAALARLQALPPALYAERWAAARAVTIAKYPAAAHWDDATLHGPIEALLKDWLKTEIQTEQGAQA